MNSVEETLRTLDSSIAFHNKHLEEFESAYTDLEMHDDYPLSEETIATVTVMLQKKIRYHEHQKLGLIDYKKEIMDKYNIGEN